MKDAGAILLAVTNVPEVCMWWESVNVVYGRTSNPYDSRRISGGSSGGEAALISAAGSVIGIGSDIAGSIRIPCYFNGVFGLKPTPGMFSVVTLFCGVEIFCKIRPPNTKYLPVCLQKIQL